MTNWLEEAQCIVSTIEKSGALLKEISRSKNLECQLKSERDFVTQGDFSSEKNILEAINHHFPEHSIFSEESGEQKLESEYCWVVDPLCSTNNFAFGLPLYGIAVALIQKNKFIYGVIHLPEFGSTIVAERGHGAFLNGNPTHVASCEKLSDAMVMYDNQFHLSTKASSNLLKILPSVFTVRISGSAAYDNFLVATGIAGCRIFHKTKLVDFAAAVAVVEEAGGRVSDFNGEPVTLQSTGVVVSNGKIHEEILELLRGE